MAKINSTETSGSDAVDQHSPSSNTPRQTDVKGQDPSGHLAIESARYLDAQQDIRTAHDAMCLADAAEMMKMSRQKMRDDYTSFQSSAGRVSNMGNEDDDTSIHVGNATYHVSSQDTSQNNSGYAKALWPIVIATALFAGVPPTVLSVFFALRTGQPEAPSVIYEGGEDTDSRNTLRPYEPHRGENRDDRP